MATYGTFVDGVSLKAAEANDFFTDINFTPVLRQSTVPTLSTAAGAYLRVNKIVFAWFRVVASSSGSTGNRIEIDLPVTAASSSVEVIGAGFYLDASATSYRHMAIVQFSTTRMAFLTSTGTSMTTYLGLTNGPNLRVETGDSFWGHVQYEVA